MFESVRHLTLASHEIVISVVWTATGSLALAMGRTVVQIAEVIGPVETRWWVYVRQSLGPLDV